MKVLFASSEIFPFSKSGGLADVSYSLPKELKKFCSIIKITPLYNFIDRKNFNIILYKKNLFVMIGQKKYKFDLYKKDDTFFIYNNILCDKEKMYGYENDWLRFGIFSYIICSIANMLKADTIHLNDWHTALSALKLKEQKNHAKVILTIHNLAYQGIFDKKVLSELDINEKYFDLEILEFYGKVNFLKAGIAFSDKITTVSPNYAKEILTKKYGCGLDGFLKKHAKKIIGVINGIDTKFFNPKNDKNLKYNYDINSIYLKRKNKKEFEKDKNIPLFIFIGRLVEQKGISLILDNLKEFNKLKSTFIFLGEGDEKVENILAKQIKKYENIYYIKGYDEKLSHKLYASADFLLMPSLFEPCGLNQMISAKYGTIPIVHDIGGLKDTVFEDKNRCARGIVFDKYKKEEFLEAVKRAIKLYKNKKLFNQICKFDMCCDFSFEKSAKRYFDIYE